jgi:hypothetical protein
MTTIKPRREWLAARLQLLEFAVFHNKEQRETATKQQAFRCYFRSRIFGSPGFPPKMKRCPL